MSISWRLPTPLFDYKDYTQNVSDLSKHSFALNHKGEIELQAEIQRHPDV